jgi:PTS system mannose-specific IIB component/fructoselysine and glucoselysine-specific PTS system IIB component
MSIALYRVDDRLIHGQVVVGWGAPLGVGFIVLVDEQVSGNVWEQDLYRMGVPPGIEVHFSSVAEAARRHPEWAASERPGILLTGDIETMAALRRLVPSLDRINLGGLHHRPGRTERLPYLYLTEEEGRTLDALAAQGVKISAQDVPTAAPVPLEALR